MEIKFVVNQVLFNLLQGGIVCFFLIIISIKSDSFRFDPFKSSGFVNNAFKQSDDGTIIKWALIVRCHFVKYPFFARGVIYRHFQRF